MKREDGLNDGLDEKRGMKIPTRKDSEKQCQAKLKQQKDKRQDRSAVLLTECKQSCQSQERNQMKKKT